MREPAFGLLAKPAPMRRQSIKFKFLAHRYREWSSTKQASCRPPTLTSSTQLKWSDQWLSGSRAFHLNRWVGI